MPGRLKGVWLNLTQNLAFVPAVLMALFGAAGITLVEVDENVNTDGVPWLFQGDGDAARTVLSVIAGSLITVAGLTFSITMVVLQLASSQFTPRVLRTFFGDRVTQLTIGTYVGTFIYAILVLRAVGSFGESGFVPRLSVTVASLMGIAAVVLLVVFLHHVSLLVQVSHVSARIARATAARTEALFPEGYGDDSGDEETLERWRSEAAGGRVYPDRMGFVRRIELASLEGNVAGEAERLAMLVAPGDLVGVDTPLAEVWPATAAEACTAAVRAAVSVADERDLDQDVDFGLRQLTDVALKGVSPGINDPMTAVTCIGYMRSILVTIAGRADPPALQRFSDDGPPIFVTRPSYEERLDGFVQISRYAASDAWVTGELLGALAGCGEAAVRAGAPNRAANVRAIAESITERALPSAETEADREHLKKLLRGVPG